MGQRTLHEGSDIQSEHKKVSGTGRRGGKERGFQAEGNTFKKTQKKEKKNDS